MTRSLQCSVNCFLNTDESSFGRAGKVLQEQKPEAFWPAGSHGTARSHFSLHVGIS